MDYTSFTDQEKLFPDGWYGFGMACVLMSFATGGAYYVSELGGEMKNPHHDLPRAIILQHASCRLFHSGRVDCRSWYIAN